MGIICIFIKKKLYKNDSNVNNSSRLKKTLDLCSPTPALPKHLLDWDCIIEMAYSDLYRTLLFDNRFGKFCETWFSV